jgi:hypothetical protein
MYMEVMHFFTYYLSPCGTRHRAQSSKQSRDCSAYFQALKKTDIAMSAYGYLQGAAGLAAAVGVLARVGPAPPGRFSFALRLVGARISRGGFSCVGSALLGPGMIILHVVYMPVGFSGVVLFYCNRIHRVCLDIHVWGLTHIYTHRERIAELSSDTRNHIICINRIGSGPTTYESTLP